jgi:aspartyl protease family protein
MVLSSGSRGLLVDIVGWMAALGVCAFAIVYSAEIRTTGYKLTGITPPNADSAVASRGQTRSGGDTASGARTSGAHAELKVGANGHFLSEADVNGRRINVMVDTGASIVALTYEDARAIGVAPRPSEFTHQVSTANGTARVAPVLLDRVQIGNVMVRGVQAAVIEEGKLQTTLLGNSFLSKLSRYEMRNGVLVMEE